LGIFKIARCGFVLLLLQCWLLLGRGFAHPPSGIVVDDQGRIYFLDHGLVRIEPSGSLTTIQDSSGGHWMALDTVGNNPFVSTLGPYHRVSVDGNSLFFGDGAPLAFGPDGSLYYATNGSREESFPAGALAVARLSPSGERSLFSPQLQEELARHQDGIQNLIFAADGSLYVSTWKGILKLDRDGSITRRLYPIAMPDCDNDPADHNPANASSPLLRGIGVDAEGNLYVAATSCHRVLKIAPDGSVQTILKSERPWTPTGIAVAGRDVYVLEYTNANGPRTEGWYPRVQRLRAGGTWKTLVAVTPPAAMAQPQQK
jgi:sugar lactone lactonase YvrE